MKQISSRRAGARLAMTAVAFTTGIAVGAAGISAAVTSSTSTTSTSVPSEETSSTTTSLAPAPTATPTRVSHTAVYPDCSMPNPGDNALAMSVSGLSDLGYSSPFWPAGSVRVDKLKLRFERRWVPTAVGSGRDSELAASATGIGVSLEVSTDGVDGPITQRNVQGLTQVADRPDVSISTPRCSRNGTDGTSWELVLKSALVQVTDRNLNGDGNVYSIKLSTQRVQFRYTKVAGSSWAKPLSAWFGEGSNWDPGRVVAPSSPPPCEGDGAADRSTMAVSLGGLAPSSLSSNAWPPGSISVSNVDVAYSFSVAVNSLGGDVIPSISAQTSQAPGLSFDTTDPLALYDLTRLNLRKGDVQVSYPTCTYGGVAKSSASYLLRYAAVSMIAINYDGFRFRYSGAFTGERLKNSTTKPTGTGSWGTTYSFG